MVQMRRKSVVSVFFVVSFLVVFLGLTATLEGTQSPAAGQATYTFKAELIDPDVKAKKKEATVVVTTQGVQIVDPSTVNETPRVGQGHLHYRVDNGPVIATTATKLSFHELAPGARQIEVTLVGNDHMPLTAPITFTVKVPES